MAKVIMTITNEDCVVLDTVTFFDGTEDNELGQIMLSRCITDHVEHKFENEDPTLNE